MPALFHPIAYGSGAMVPDTDTNAERARAFCRRMGYANVEAFRADPVVVRVREVIFNLLMLKKDGYPGSRLSDLVLGVPNGLVATVLEVALLAGEVRRVRYAHKPNDFEYRLTIEKWVEMESQR